MKKFLIYAAFYILLAGIFLLIFIGIHALLSIYLPIWLLILLFSLAAALLGPALRRKLEK